MSSETEIWAQPTSHSRTDAAIETTSLTRYFGGRKVVDSLTMSVPKGSVCAFLGRNGSGKTTTIRMLLGLLDPTRGSSRVLGYDSRNLPPEALDRIGYMPESHETCDWWTVDECGEYQSRFYSRWSPRIFKDVIDHFKLHRWTRAGDLSRGERAGLSLAITLAPQPDLLILDDPAIGLDPVARRSLLESMIYVTAESERTVFFSSHLMEDVERVADHIAILDRSVLRACCPIETFRANVRQFVLHYPAGQTPPPLSNSLRGLLRAQRSDGQLRLTLAAPDESVQRAMRELRATSIEEVPVSFSDAVIGYLGDRGEQKFFLDGKASPIGRTLA